MDPFPPDAENEETPRFEFHNFFGVLGFSLFLAWVISVLTNPLLFTSVSEQIEPFYARLAFLTTSLIMLAIYMVISRYRLFRKGLSIVLILLILCIPIGGIFSGFTKSSLFPVISFWALTGFGTSVLLVLWGTFLSTLNHYHAIRYPPISVGLAILILLFDKVLVVEAATSLILLLPIASFVIYLCERNTRGVKHGIGIFVAFYGGKNNPSLRQLVLWRSVLGTFCNSICLGFAFYYVASVGIIENSIICYIAIILASVLLFIDSIKFRFFNMNFTLKTIVPYASLCLLPIAFIQSQLWLICCGVMIGMSWLYDLICWGEIAEHTRVNETVPSFVISFDRFGNLFGIAVGYILAFLTFGHSIVSSLQYQFIPSVIVIFLIFVQYFAFADSFPYQFMSGAENKQMKALKNQDYMDNFGPWKTKCLAFSSFYQLTPREQEVLLLLARGRNTNYIESQLFISSHTVKAHVYNIYKKTCTHSRQELITLIERFEG